MTVRLFLTTNKCQWGTFSMMLSHAAGQVWASPKMQLPHFEKIGLVCLILGVERLISPAPILETYRACDAALTIWRQIFILFGPAVFRLVSNMASIVKADLTVNTLLNLLQTSASSKPWAQHRVMISVSYTCRVCRCLEVWTCFLWKKHVNGVRGKCASGKKIS